MTIREQMQQKARPLRLGFFAAWALMAIPMLFKLEPPYSYAIGAGVLLAVVVLPVAYRAIRCPRCGGSLWLAGMGFVAPNATSGAGHNCPKCGVGYGESAGLQQFIHAEPASRLGLIQASAPMRTPRKESHMARLLLLALLVVSSSASAIVIRDDVDDSEYRVPPSDFPALADMPGEGHGVLIAPQWVITAAHAITWQSEIKHIEINGTSRDVERLVVHPGYKKPPQQLLDHALATWDWTLFTALLSSSDDIALLKLAQPATDVSPVAIHRGGDEFGQIVKIIGKGATGTGLTGYDFNDSHRTGLRRAYNKVTSAHGRWVCYVFDKPSETLPLEGGSGSGDSGGPILIQAEADWLLAGLTSWTVAQGTTKTPPGQYGQISCNVRLGHYLEWIESVISAQS